MCWSCTGWNSWWLKYSGWATLYIAVSSTATVSIAICCMLAILFLALLTVSIPPYDSKLHLPPHCSPLHNNICHVWPRSWKGNCSCNRKSPDSQSSLGTEASFCCVIFAFICHQTLPVLCVLLDFDRASHWLKFSLVDTNVSAMAFNEFIFIYCSNWILLTIGRISFDLSPFGTNGRVWQLRAVWQWPARVPAQKAAGPSGQGGGLLPVRQQPQRWGLSSDEGQQSSGNPR